MSARQQRGPYDDLSRKWLALAERRKAHLTDLYETGRWKHYYTEAKIVDDLRATTAACEDWAKIVNALPPEDATQTDLWQPDLRLADLRNSLRSVREAILPDHRYRA